MCAEPTGEGALRPERPDARIQRARQDARTEIGDALHDGVLQSMTALMLRLAVGGIEAPAAVRAALDEVEVEMSQVVTELRNLVSSLRSPDGDTDDLTPPG